MKLELARITHERNAFWSTGNFPTQKAFSLSEHDVYMHLVGLILLSKRVLASASFYYESRITRKVVRRLDHAFKSGDVLFFINEQYDCAKDHGEAKMPGDLL